MTEAEHPIQPDPQKQTPEQNRQGDPRSIKEKVVDWWNSLRRKKSEKQGRTRGERPERGNEQKPFSDHIDADKARESQRLAELGNDSFQVLPSDTWALHYPNGFDRRTEQIANLLEGSTDPQDAVADLTPDALLYAQHELTDLGFQPVRDRIFDTVTTHDHYGYPRLSEFLSSLSGLGIDAQTGQEVYDSLVSGRIQREMLDAYEPDDRARIVTYLRQEAQAIGTNTAWNGEMQQIIAAVKTSWTHDQDGLRNPLQQSIIEGALTAEQREIYERLRNDYALFANTSDDEAWDRITREIREFYSNDENQEEDADTQTDLKENSPEYQPPSEKDTRARYEVTSHDPSVPTPLGYFPENKLSVFDRATMEWVDTNTRSSYTQSIQGGERHVVKSLLPMTEPGMYAIPLPEGYVIDANSFGIPGAIQRDEAGCFFVNGAAVTTIEGDIVRQESVDTTTPQSEHITLLYSGSLSADTEQLLTILSQSTQPNAEKADQIDRYIQEHHVYPSEEELKDLQQEMKAQSTPDTYIANIDASEILDCYLGNTLAVALLRKANIPARLVKGYNVKVHSEAKTTELAGKDAHAWLEFWDGSQWILKDFTPAKPSQAQQKKEATEGENGELTHDNNAENRREGGEAMVPADIPKEGATDQDLQKGQTDMQGLQQYIELADELYEQRSREFDEVQSFADLDALKKAIEDDPLFSDMMSELEQRAQALEEKRMEEVLVQMAEMERDGFLTPEKRAGLKKALEEYTGVEKDEVVRKLRDEGQTYQEFKSIQQFVEPMVRRSVEYLTTILPRFPEVDIDSDSYADEGELDPDALTDPGRLVYGDIYNPPVERPEIRPNYIADMMIDVSLSMDWLVQGGNVKRIDAAKVLAVYFNEVFNELGKAHGYQYIHSSISTFAKDVRAIKTIDQKYDSSERYRYTNPDGSVEYSTVKARMFNALNVRPYSYLLEAVKQSARTLDAAQREYPDFASALYFIGDGDDTKNRASNIRNFLSTSKEFGGFGRHMRHAIMIGEDSQRRILAEIFGDDNTAVANSVNELAGAWMTQFARDVRHRYPDSGDDN